MDYKGVNIQQQLNSVFGMLSKIDFCSFRLEKSTPQTDRKVVKYQLFEIFDTSGDVMCNNLTSRDRTMLVQRKICKNTSFEQSPFASAKSDPKKYV